MLFFQIPESADISAEEEAKIIAYFATIKNNIGKKKQQVTQDFKRIDDLIHCGKCSRTFGVKHHFNKHYKRKHSKRKIEHLGWRKFKCQECDQIFTSKTKCEGHYDYEHSSGESHKAPCPVCGTIFDKNYISIHLEKQHEYFRK